MDKEKIKQEDLGESIKKEISFEKLTSLYSRATTSYVSNRFCLNPLIRYHDEDDQAQEYSEVEGGPCK